MARHSHWANIQVTKGKTDAKRAVVFAKLAKSITVAAKEGGGDATFNFKLATAIAAAKAVNMPKDNIERAVERGVGGGSEGQLDTVVYEAMGPGGAAILVQAITDNRARTNGNLRALMTRLGLNPDAKVMWQFERKGIVFVEDLSSITDFDNFDLKLIEAGAQDIVRDEGLEVICAVADLQAVVGATTESGLTVTSASLGYIAKEPMSLGDIEKQDLADAIEALEDDDDVDAVFTNVQ